jgi:hypothetical protein
MKGRAVKRRQKKEEGRGKRKALAMKGNNKNHKFYTLHQETIYISPSPITFIRIFWKLTSWPLFYIHSRSYKVICVYTTLRYLV